MVTINKSITYILIIGSFIFCHNNLSAGKNADNITNFKIDPDHIEIGAFFDGVPLLVSAEIPQSDGVVIELEGKIQDVTLNKKGKRAFIWLNVAQIKVKNAPSLYILASSDQLDKICSQEELEDELLGYVAIRRKITFESDKPLTGIEFDEFIKLKEHNGSYNINGKVKVDRLPNDRQKVTATMHIPSFIPAGDYELFLYCFREGKLFKKASANVMIEEVGLTLLTKDLAFNEPAIYGISAIIIALSAGIMMGLIFSKRSGGAH